MSHERIYSTLANKGFQLSLIVAPQLEIHGTTLGKLKTMIRFVYDFLLLM